ncbi:MAG: AAA family ATPase, partial [Candidatus Paceibacterota bacterium]
MRLKTLEVDGFKSFSKHTRLTFNSSISAIVGPNGSGKSNIAEAFRFVLSEQSMKSMRGKRGEDMIFNGSNSHGRSNRAQVKITLDNNDRLLDIDYNEVVIERVVHRDGANEYYLNGSPARLRDIRELIAGAHIGSSGHHIISQGEADKIIEASPAGRKEMIEDALGLRIYQAKRLESIRKLERTRENIKETQTQRREVAPRLRELARIKERIEQVRQMKQDLQTQSLEYFAREYAEIEAQKQEGGDKRTPLEQKKQQLEAELAEKRSHVEVASTENDQSTKLREIDGQIAELSRLRDELTRELGRIEGELALHQRVIAQANKTDEHNATRKVYLKHVEDTADFIEKQIQQAEQAGTVEKMKEAFGAIRESLANFIQANREEQDDVSVKEARAEIERLEGEKGEIEQKRNMLDGEKKQREEEYRGITDSVEERKDSTRDAERAIYELRTQLSGVTNELERLDARARSLGAREEEMNQDLARIGQVVGRAVLDYKNHDLDEQTDGEAPDQGDRRKELERFLIRLEDNAVEAGDDMLREYEDLVEKDQFLERELEDLEKSAVSLEELIAELEETLEREFQIGLKKINNEFQKL